MSNKDLGSIYKGPPFSTTHRAESAQLKPRSTTVIFSLLTFSSREMMKFLMAGKGNKSSLEVKPIAQDMERDEKKYYYGY